ncbi:S9 family peptidase [Winogradskyella vincentii]|uniref:S9 family peptidase n=1 Tax=Winogradskyella vincentii TaxID=2877122 RepID=A0ABS7XZW4_9FLAO|nr:S9 family peptidase [Winogradskyella vincentii]MCA0153205.1 S9 family peptidase [Winogradskyella vincentii]
MLKKSNSIYPIAKKKPQRLEMHGDVRIDNYFWMNERENKEVIDYLKAENNYCDEKMSHTKEFQESLFIEMKARIKEDDSSVPYKYNGYWYITKFEKGKDYPIYTRKKDSLDNPEELLFDCNEMAEGHNYFKIVGISISPDNKLVSYGIDLTGRRQYTIYIKNLVTREILKDSMESTTGSSSWANDNKTIFYTKKDQVTLRAHQIYKHKLGDNQDDLLFEEGDTTFGVTVYKTKSRRYIIIACYSTLTNEYHILDADKPEGKFQLFQERIRGVEYSISHYKDHFFVLTNKDNSTNFKLMKTSIHDTSIEKWEDVVSHRNDVLIENIDIFKDYLVISERSNGLNQIRIKRWDNHEDYYLPFDNETYTCYTTTNIEFDTDVLRYGYNSLTTPASIIEYNLKTKSKIVLKEQEVLGGKFKKENYISERIWAKAEDGAKIPISIVYKKGIKKNGKNPLLQYAYGSYGSTVDPYFSTIRLSLLDRGFIYAIAHVRGGEYLGRPWYEDGKLLNKKNSFSDFINCSIELIKQRFTSSKHLYAMGGSAGGLLIGAVINEAPELYNGVIAAVPFVDVITTMLDDSIPLTTGEYDEWGNPNDKLYYDYMKSYSPYDNVEAKKYPHMLVTSGLHDSQVQYWEPTKWVAKLRELKTDSNQLYLRTNMDAGHGGASGRFESLREDAEEFAFLLDLEGIRG